MSAIQDVLKRPHMQDVVNVMKEIQSTDGNGIGNVWNFVVVWIYATHIQAIRSNANILEKFAHICSRILQCSFEDE